MSHKPSLLFRKPCNTRRLSFQASKCVFVNTILQPSSHNRPSEMRNALFKSLKTCAIFACVDKCCSGSNPLMCAVICLLFGRYTVGNVVCVRLERMQLWPERM